MVIPLLKRRWLQRLTGLVLVAYAVVIAWLSLMPVTTAAPVSDKLLHVAAYGLFMLLTTPLVLVGSMRRLWLVAGAIWLYSGAMEGGQAFVPGRYPDGLDMVANGAGVVAAGLLLLLLKRAVAADTPQPMGAES